MARAARLKTGACRGLPEARVNQFAYGGEDMVRLSILDLAPITQGNNAATAFRHSLDYARYAERLGIHRYWLAEHHNMPGIASAQRRSSSRTSRRGRHRFASALAESCSRITRRS